MSKSVSRFIYILIFSFISFCVLNGNPDSLGVRKTYLVTGVGDIMLGSSFPSVRFLPPGDNPLALLGSLADTLAASDVTFGNLEGAFLDNGSPVKKCRDTTICYLFRMPERYAGALAASGFDLISLANNHSGDFGAAAINRTCKIFDSLDIKYAGLSQHPWSIYVKDSVRYGFCAFSPNAGTLSITDTAQAASVVRNLSDSCDIVIVSFHGGAEGADYQHVPRNDEIFYTENRGNVYAFAHKMIDAGADIIFGHGPHVTRAVEVYRDRFIGYSLGNFCTYGKFNILGPNGIAPVIRLRVDREGKFLSGRIIPVFQTKADGVRIDQGKRVIKKIQELVASDFPDAVTQISDDGDIFYR